MENVGWFEKQASWFQVSRFGAMTLMMTFLTCYGSIAAMYSIMNKFYVGMALAAFVTLLSNIAFIAQISSKLCLMFFYIGLVINTLLIIGNILI